MADFETHPRGTGLLLAQLAEVQAERDDLASAWAQAELDKAALTRTARAAGLREAAEMLWPNEKSRAAILARAADIEAGK